MPKLVQVPAGARAGGCGGHVQQRTGLAVGQVRQRRIHDGALSGMDLTARHPRADELLSTVNFMVQTLVAAGELQRDLQRELTHDGLRAAEAKGNKGGRRTAIAADKTDDVRTAYLGGQSITSLAREYDVSRGAIRTAVADLLPEYTAAAAQDAPAPELPVVLDMPGKVADFLRAAELGPAERGTLDQGVTVRRGQGYTLRVSTTPEVHPQFLDRCQLPAASCPTTPQRSRHSARPAASTRTASTLSAGEPDPPKPTVGLLVPWCPG